MIAARVRAAGVGALSRPVLLTAFEGTMRTTAMIILIIIAAYFLNLVFAAIGLAAAMEHFVSTLGLGPYQTILVIAIFYIVLGCFMETLSMMIATVPVVTPIVVSLGFDPVWFGIVVVVVIEISLITPPVGLNVFILKGVVGDVSTATIFRGVTPFWLMDILRLILLLAFPTLVLFLPSQM